MNMKYAVPIRYVNASKTPLTVPTLVYALIGNSSIIQSQATLILIELSAPCMKIENNITSSEVVQSKTPYITSAIVMPNATSFYLPYLSPNLGSQSSVLAHPTKYIVPIRPTFQDGSHMRSSFYCQLRRVFSAS